MDKFLDGKATVPYVADDGRTYWAQYLQQRFLRITRAGRVVSQPRMSREEAQRFYQRATAA